MVENKPDTFSSFPREGRNAGDFAEKSVRPLPQPGDKALDMTNKLNCILLCAAAFGASTVQAVEPANGTAVVVVGDQEYTIPVSCDDTSRPAAGVYTEPQKVTRERTGRSSGVRLTIRPWKDTSDVVVSLDGYVAWIPSPASTGGVLKLSLAMSPASYVRDGAPVALTYDEWMAGNRPEGKDSVDIEVNCLALDPAAPAFRKLSPNSSGG